MSEFYGLVIDRLREVLKSKDSTPGIMLALHVRTSTDGAVDKKVNLILSDAILHEESIDEVFGRVYDILTKTLPRVRLKKRSLPKVEKASVKKSKTESSSAASSATGPPPVKPFVKLTGCSCLSFCLCDGEEECGEVHNLQWGWDAKDLTPLILRETFKSFHRHDNTEKASGSTWISGRVIPWMQHHYDDFAAPGKTIENHAEAKIIRRKLSQGWREEGLCTSIPGSYWKLTEKGATLLIQSLNTT